MRAAAQAPGHCVRSEKIVLIGAASSGKTALVNRFSRDSFQEHSEATIGAAFVAKLVRAGGAELKLEIWDTGGTEKYKALAPMYYRDARAAIVVFDVTNAQSFRDAAGWISEFRDRGQPSALMACAANKVDLAERRAVTSEEIDQFASENQLTFWRETSALSGAGVHALFAELAALLVGLPSAGGAEVAFTEDDAPQGGAGCC
jgi:Ras-related protein Rab-5C